jgi:hypothetical protein
MDFLAGYELQKPGLLRLGLYQIALPNQIEGSP